MASIDEVSISIKSKIKPIRFSGKIIGEIRDRTAVFFVTERHWYRAGNGFTVDPRTLDQLKQRIDALMFFDKRAGTQETIPISTFLVHAWLTKDYGWGRKLVCDSRWYDGRADEIIFAPEVSECAECKERQLVLFDLPKVSSGNPLGHWGNAR